MDARVLLLPAAVLLSAYRVWRLRPRGVRIGAALGLSLDARSAVDALVGALVSILSLSTIFLFEWGTGLLTIHRLGRAEALVQDWSTPIIVGFIEEYVFRCAIIGALMLWTTARAAVSVSAVVFAAAHLPNPNINMLAIACYLVGGIAYGAAFAQTERVWLPFGLHAGWNYAEGRLLGFSLSGFAVPNPFVLQQDNGPALWTGGGYGPEGGVLGVVARAIVLALLFAWLRARPVEGVERITV